MIADARVRTNILPLIEKVLGGPDEMFVLHLGTTQITEGSGQATVRIQVTGNFRGDIQGLGVGPIDALFAGIKRQFAVEYPSLNTITFVGFTSTFKEGSGGKQGRSGADAEVTVVLTLKTRDGTRLQFQQVGSSINAAAFNAVLEAACFFINSERAYIAAYRALEDARTRDRAEIEDQWKAVLATLVAVTSYSEVVAKITRGTR